MAIPYCIYHLGFILGILLNLLFVLISFESGNIYILLHDMLPNKPTSLFEIGFIIVGRKAIFINALNNLVNNTCLTIIYLMIFGETTA